MNQSFVTTKPAAFFDGYERMMGMIRRHGWTQARDMFNEQYPHEWKPATMDQWHHSKGMIEALQATM
jgi:hypothetical protein